MDQSTLRKIESISQHIIKEIKPSPEDTEILKAAANELMGRLKEALPSNVEIILAGSVARGTHLKDDSDIDIFLLFPKASDERAMEKKGLEAAKKVVDRKRGEQAVINYSEHPYLQLIMKNPPVKADIVPAFKIVDSFEIGSAVDRTPLHNQFVNSHLDGKQKDDVRILKAFMRYHNIYGADAKAAGFSGYLCELLVCHYGSFANVIDAFSKIELPLQINMHSNANIDWKKFKSDFIVIDPTDPNRNVAAAVSKDTLARFALYSAMFLENTTLDFFYGKRFSLVNSRSKLNAIIKKTSTELYAVSFKLPDITEDIIWQQLKRFAALAKKELDANSFKPIIDIINVGSKNAVYAAFVGSAKSSYVARAGPSCFAIDAAMRFLHAHDVAYVSDGTLYSIEAPRFKDPKELLAKLKDSLPSHLEKSTMKIFVNKLPEELARLVYSAYMEKIL